MSRAAPLPFRPPTSPIGANPGQPGERGRGARSNESGRYENERREAADDDWAAADGAPRKTRVTVERPRKIITRNTSPDVPFDRSINPYRGCEHGCAYCFARPTHAYMGLSPGLDFETRLFVKRDAAALLARELRAPRYKPKPIAFGTNTDPYQPIEREFRVMRDILKVLSAFGHPATILTKSALILRDLDLLAPLAERGLVKAALSITTEDARLARAMEPRASTPEKRFGAIAGLAEAGVPVGVMTAPMIPGLNDGEMETLLERARAAGACEAGYTFLKLPLEVAPIFHEWLEACSPARASRVLRHIRDANNGREYDPEWGSRMRGRGAYADMLAARFRAAVKRLGFRERDVALDTSQFRPPETPNRQYSLFA